MSSFKTVHFVKHTNDESAKRPCFTGILVLFVFLQSILSQKSFSHILHVVYIVREQNSIQKPKEKAFI